MALGRRKNERQTELWVTAPSLPVSPGHVFYQKLNQLLSQDGFDAWVEELCAPFYSDRGRRGIPPGVYFRMLMVGYFEGLSSQRAIAWRCADSLSIREFLGVPLTEGTPDHSSLTVIRDRLPAEVVEQAFAWVLKVANRHKLLDSATVGVDSTMLEANAAMKTIIRRDTGEDWQAYITKLMREEGVIDPDATPTVEEIKRYDRRRQGKSVSHDDWQSPSDPDSRIMRMKDGRTHLAYKAEHAVDLSNEIILSAEVYPANTDDRRTVEDTVIQAEVNLQQAGVKTRINAVVCDKGYHSTALLETLAQQTPYEVYIAEPKQPTSRVGGGSNKTESQRAAVEANGRRCRSERGRQLQRSRSEKVERTFAHVCETGGARRTWLRGTESVRKRYLVAALTHNLGRIMRAVFGIGTPRGCQGLAGACLRLWTLLLTLQKPLWSLVRVPRLQNRQRAWCLNFLPNCPAILSF